MAKRFMYVCFGILALVVAFHVGAEYGQASYVDHSTTGIVASAGDGIHFLLEDGTVRTFHTVQGWSPFAPYDLPIPVSQVKFWGLNFFISTANEIWVTDGVYPWANYGSPPGLVGTEATTWGQIKAEFGK
jgi:hypothetical protein